MQVRVLWIGKTRLPGIATLTEEYSRRLTRFCQFQAEEIRARGKGIPGRTAEEEKMLARSGHCYRVVLDPEGQRWNSAEFARFLQTMQHDGQRAVCFCVGGAEGFSRGFRQTADVLLSLSPLTLPHELARVVLLEHIYRAFALLAHHPYPR
ncbi:MAG: 23S rRNA (pseudouridine(1915)-N(3))-methyltransferase RlmH [Acidobacteria bacterium]|nr:23S rRNA (pseudouridine(1915)-N(3))-methyltransferase RlmH [Acidobacteriota bacterium]